MASNEANLRAVVSKDGAAILHTHLGRITTLNATGALVWQGLERGDPIDAIAEDLARATGQTKEVVIEDIAAFLETLKAQDLLPG